jgi:aminoglycoside 6'-N-acetyltransferase
MNIELRAARPSDREFIERTFFETQHYLVADYPEYLAPIGDDEAAGVDFLIGDESYVGKGLGPQIIAKYVKEVVVPRHAGIRRVVLSPNPENRRSIRALEKAGFRQVKAITVVGQPERLCVLDLDVRPISAVR